MFILASWFSVISRNADEKNFLCREMLNRRLSFYEKLLRWLPEEHLANVISSKDFNLSSYRSIFTKHFGEFTDFIVRARLYASDEVTAELISFQESYNSTLSKILRDKISDELFIDLIERGKDPFAPLLNLHKLSADRVILIISEEMRIDNIQKSFRKSRHKRNKKHKNTDRKNKC